MIAAVERVLWTFDGESYAREIAELACEVVCEGARGEVAKPDSVRTFRGRAYRLEERAISL
jgi:hypothetical protein